MQEKQREKQSREALRISLEREVQLMREALGNLVREEKLCGQESSEGELNSYQALWQALMDERKELAQQLTLARYDRQQRTEELESIAPARMFPDEDPSSLAIHSLAKQALFLVERINLQKDKNRGLSPPPRRAHPVPVKRTVKIATFPPEEAQ